MTRDIILLFISFNENLGGNIYINRAPYMTHIYSKESATNAIRINYNNSKRVFIIKYSKTFHFLYRSSTPLVLDDPRHVRLKFLCSSVFYKRWQLMIGPPSSLWEVFGNSMKEYNCSHIQMALPQYFPFFFMISSKSLKIRGRTFDMPTVDR